MFQYDMSNSRINIKLICICVFVVVVFPSQLLLSEELPTASMKEVKILLNKYKELPSFCQCRLAQRDIVSTGEIQKMPRAFASIVKKWERKIGKRAWSAMHHYCFGIQRLNDANRIQKCDPNSNLQRKGHLNMAISEFKFIRRYIDSNFPLWRNLLLYEAQIYTLLNRPDLAALRKSQAAKYSKRK